MKPEMTEVSINGKGRVNRSLNWKVSLDFKLTILKNYFHRVLLKKFDNFK